MGLWSLHLQFCWKWHKHLTYFKCFGFFFFSPQNIFKVLCINLHLLLLIGKVTKEKSMVSTSKTPRWNNKILVVCQSKDASSMNSSTFKQRQSCSIEAKGIYHPCINAHTYWSLMAVFVRLLHWAVLLRTSNAMWLDFKHNAQEDWEERTTIFITLCLK